MNTATKIMVPEITTPAEAEAFVHACFDHYDLFGWTFKWDRATKRMGQTNYTRRTLSLSLPLFSIPENIAQVADTILHEIAHIIAGFDAGHGPAWRHTAVMVGAKPQRCGSVAVLVPSKWVGICGAGCENSRKHGRDRAPKPGVAHRCRGCGERVAWVRNG